MPQPSAPPRSGPVKLVLGGRLPLDFANTRLRVGEREDIPDFSCFARWCWQMHLITSQELNALLREGSASDPDARAASSAALDFREAVYRVFLAVSYARPAPADDLARISELAGEARLAQELSSKKREGYRWSWRPSVPLMRRPLLEIADSASELLTGGSLSRVKECPAPDGCGWLFFDDSKNQSRRWCSMAYCGASAKARRFIQKKHLA